MYQWPDVDRLDSRLRSLPDPMAKYDKRKEISLNTENRTRYADTKRLREIDIPVANEIFSRSAWESRSEKSLTAEYRAFDEANANSTKLERRS